MKLWNFKSTTRPQNGQFWAILGIFLGYIALFVFMLYVAYVLQLYNIMTALWVHPVVQLAIFFGIHAFMGEN